MTRYFGYGSNLDAADFAAFCARHGFADARLLPVSTALLLDHTLAFDRHARSRQGGTLNLRAQPGQAVEGVLFDANDAALDALDAKEGAPEAYRRITRHLVLPDGRAVEAMTCAAPSEGFHAPRADHLGVIARGRAAHGIADAMVAHAARDEPAPLTVAHLFVYGTLMAGEPNAHHLEGVPRRPGRVTARLHDCGAYPAACLGDGEVQGELVALPLERLAGMDALEGSAPGGAPGGMYRRSVLPVRHAGGATRAYIYLMDDAGRFPPIASGDWRSKPDRAAAWAAHAARTPAEER